MDTVTTRRAMFGTAAAATVAVAFPVAASARPAPHRAHPELTQLIAAHAAGEAEIDRFYDEVFNPAVERQEERLTAVPHVVRSITPFAGDNRERVWTTENRFDVACVGGIVKVSRTSPTFSQDPAAIQRRREARSFWAAHLRRQRVIQHIHDDPNVAAASEEERRLLAAHTAREKAIEQFPVRSLADLAAKLDFISAGGFEPRVDLPALLACDVARLMGGEA